MKIIRFKRISSTNDYLKMRHADLPDKTIITAETQSKGRGRNKRRWISGKGGLWFSILIKHEKPERSFLHSFKAAVCVAKLTGGNIKWPNDVTIRGRKVCGILTENVIRDDHTSTIVGVGININNRQPLPTATTLRRETGKDWDLDSFLSSFISLYSEEMDVLAEWRRYWNAVPTVLKTKDGIIKGTPKGIDKEGRLILGRKHVSEGEIV